MKKFSTMNGFQLFTLLALIGFSFGFLSPKQPSKSSNSTISNVQTKKLASTTKAGTLKTPAKPPPYVRKRPTVKKSPTAPRVVPIKVNGQPSEHTWGTTEFPICPQQDGYYGVLVHSPLPNPCVSITVESTWTMAPRFGLDENNNGITDLPNSPEYVRNNPVEGGEVKFKVTLIPQVHTSFTPAGYIEHAFRQTQTSWTITPLDGQGSGASIKESTTGDHWLEKDLAEGEWEVQWERTIPFPEPVLVQSPNGAYGYWKNSLTVFNKQRIQVKDLLIVSIGDSYSSGEGNPEKRVPLNASECSEIFPEWDLSGMEIIRETGQGKRVQWADDGGDNSDFIEMCEMIRTENFVDPDLGEYYESIRKLQPVRPQTSSEVAKAHIKAHRSTAAWPAQVALAIEKEDDQTSVTFVSLATTGASITHGLLGPTKGSSGEKIVLKDGQEIPIPYAPPGYTYTSHNHLPSQIKELKRIIGNRKIDMLLISIGGNDVGFSKAVEGLMIKGHWASLLRYTHIWDGVWEGNFSKGAEVAQEEWLGPGADDYLTGGYVTGMNKLLDRYDDLNDSLQENFGEDISEKTVIIEYPDFTSQFYSYGINMVVPCEKIMEEAKPKVWIDPEERDWALANILHPLNDRVQLAAEGHGWLFVDGIQDAFQGHGYCEGAPYNKSNFARWMPEPSEGTEAFNEYNEIYENRRWLRREGESQVIQGLFDKKSTKGSLHPNEFGHRAIKEQVLDKLQSEERLDSQLRWVH